MGLPSQLKNGNAWIDGDSFLGEFTKVNLGDLKEKTEKIRPGGVLGEIDTPMGIEQGEIEITCAGLWSKIITRFGRAGVASTLFRWQGAYQEDVEGVVKAGELVARGRIPEASGGTAEIGAKTEQTGKLIWSYIRWSEDGRVLLEIDMLNCIYIVDGEDRYADIRNAIGI
ncbi:MAG: phage major tail tube protein [Novosphingobium sp.]|nr:phage major tail tube protein [Novosphingobium sp.]